VPSSVYDRIRGTAELLFQLGLGGPQFRNQTVSSVVGIEMRNAGNTGYVVARAADPVGDDDLVTKRSNDGDFALVFLLMGA
jgi:hypothetical protein